ncbi:YpoC family protein [Bacillus marinisedimentorum]|uniref:YpoC family protein n=1 Tax=Bacillus marinisedimentorum TaxID=1821260 RepID=UPI000872B140|nr:hypothetical protein [Bacillus marinisedimentorum]
MAEKLNVPAAFIHPPFFKDDSVKNQDETPFLAELLFLNGLCDKGPWQDPANEVPDLFICWDKERQGIAVLFKKKRKQEARAQMVKWTARYLQSLFWTNGLPVSGVSDLSAALGNLGHKPVNAGERLGFILESPDHYHSFIQLTQLFDETKKLFYKKLALQK